MMMSEKYTHPSEEEVLRLADGELSSRRAAVVKDHLASCWECRARQQQIEATIADFVHACHDTLDPLLAPAPGPRALLRARLAQSVTGPIEKGTWLWSLQQAFSLRTLAYAAAAFLIALLGTIGLHRVLTPHSKALVRLEPDHRLTPGAAREVSASEVCKVSYSDDARLVPAAVQHEVLQEYGMDAAQSAAYELDYLISPQLGGTNDIRNLWPEPDSSTVWNVRAKDALEDRLQELVCNGKINLATAQQELATDWISAYKRYFHTDKPLAPL